MDIFDTFNFTGARVPRFEDVRDEFPKELESSVFFSADFFRPPDRKGRAPQTPRLPLGGHPLREWGGSSQGPATASKTVLGSKACCVRLRHRPTLSRGAGRGAVAGVRPQWPRWVSSFFFNSF